MTYPEPQRSIAELSLSPSENSSTVRLVELSGLAIELEHLTNVGWSVEVRYDLHNKKFWRQPFTGAQERLARDPLSTTKKEPSRTTITVDTEQFIIDSRTGSFTVRRNNQTYFESASTPFSYHPVAVTLWEQLMSRKVTDLTGRTFGAPSNHHFESHMVRFQYPRPKTAVFGLAGQTGELNRNGYRFELYNTDEFVHTPARKPMYQSWPILFHRTSSGTGWVGIFHDNPTRTFVDVGDFYEDSVTFESLTNNTRVYICTGESLGEVSQKISTLLGGMTMPPSWAFGYQQCRWSYLSTNEVRSVVAKMQAEDIPLDAMYFDIDYMDGYRVFTNNKKEFVDFNQCIKDLHSKGVHAVAIVDPGVKIDPDYHAYRKVLESKAFLKNADETPLAAKVWPGSVLLPDFGDPKMQELWSAMQCEWLNENHLDGIWNDMNEPSNFEGGNPATAKSITARGPFLRETNLYGYYMAKTSALGWKKAFPDKPGVIITRSGYPGVQQNAVIWHGDNQTWWEHLRLAIDTTIAYSISGAFYTGPDVPGFTGNPPDDLAIRFYQLGAFLPLFRGHSIFFAKDKEPYAFSSSTKQLIKDAVVLRYSLLTEWISGFERAISENCAPLVPVFDRDGDAVRDQFLLFDKLLVAPVIERDQKRRSLFLPSGDWYRLGDTNSRIKGGDWVCETVNLKSVPVFVRAGTTLTRNTVGRNVAETLSHPVRLERYP